MKITKLALLAGAMATGFSSFAQSADEIVKKHNAAVGGEAAWGKVTSLKLAGTMTYGGMEMTGSEAILNGKGMRVDFSVQGQNGYEIMTPGHGWASFPGQGVQELPADAMKDNADALTVKDELMAAAKVEKMAFVSKDKVNDKDVFKLTGTNAKGEVTTYYVDATTYYLVRKVSKAKDQDGKDVEETEDYSDFKKLPEGITIAMTQGSDQQKLSATTAEVNTIKDESIFAPAK